MTVRIAMWSGPRNISTAMMRAFENRPDTAVSDEPFYAAYLAETGLDHPMRAEVLAGQPTDWRVVAGALSGPAPGGRAVWYQKHMTHHLLPGMDREWIHGLGNAFLIRHPTKGRVMPASQVNSPIIMGIATPATTATNPASHKRLITAGKSEFFQLVQGPTPINTNKGTMMGTNTLLK